MHLAHLGNKSQFAEKDQGYSSSCVGCILLYFELSINWNQQKLLFFEMKQSYSVTCSESFTLKSSHCRTRRIQSCRVIHIVNPAKRDRQTGDLRVTRLRCEKGDIKVVRCGGDMHTLRLPHLQRLAKSQSQCDLIQCDVASHLCD